jgi:hypothetical protein
MAIICQTRFGSPPVNFRHFVHNEEAKARSLNPRFATRTSAKQGSVWLDWRAG